MLALTSRCLEKLNQKWMILVQSVPCSLEPDCNKRHRTYLRHHKWASGPRAVLAHSSSTCTCCEFMLLLRRPNRKHYQTPPPQTQKWHCATCLSSHACTREGAPGTQGLDSSFCMRRHCSGWRSWGNSVLLWQRESGHLSLRSLPSHFRLAKLQ